MKRTLLSWLSVVACSILDAPPAVECEVVRDTLRADPCDGESCGGRRGCRSRGASI